MPPSSALKDYQIPVDQTNMQDGPHQEFPAVRPHPRETAPRCGDRRRAEVVINLAAESYREGKVMYLGRKALEGFG